MLTITDCGCYKHQACQVTFDGEQAAMMENLMANLPWNGPSYTYICVYGHTHRILRHFHEQEVNAFTSEYRLLS
jgi:hypothetical protein